MPPPYGSGTLEAVQQVLAACGWQINTAFVEVRPVGRKEASASGETARYLFTLELSVP